MEELSKSIKAYFYDRTASPLMGAFIVAWIGWNYKFVLLILSNMSFVEKIDYSSKHLFYNYTTWLVDGILIPLGVALFFLVCYPWPAFMIYKFTKRWQVKLNNEKRTLEDKQLITVEERDELKRAMYNANAENRKLLDAKDDEIRLLRDDLNKYKRKEEASKPKANSPKTSKSKTDTSKTSMTKSATPKTSSNLPSKLQLDTLPAIKHQVSGDVQETMSRLIEDKLDEFSVKAKVVAMYRGPVITRFELELAPGVKVSKVSNLSKDLARALAVVSVRVVEVIPGKAAFGLEIPNEDRELVQLSEIIESPAFEESSSDLNMCLGKDIAGQPVVVNLERMPHLLIAGTTGSGKSVSINAMIISLLHRMKPEDLRMIMIDPKMLELSVYDGIPHLLCPVVTDMKEATNSLKWCVKEMNRRYKLMSALRVRNLASYNKKVSSAIKAGKPITDPLWAQTEDKENNPPELESLPKVVLIIDELADMMMIVGKQVEELIAQIAQKSRAAGIHMILATQRPSVDVITGLIKANIPSRIALQVASKIDSRTILDQMGAEQLLGKGDMFYLPARTSTPKRVHGAFISDEEIHEVVTDWRELAAPNFIEGITSDGVADEVSKNTPTQMDNDDDVIYEKAVAIVIQTRKASISTIQRKLKLGYNRAARIIERMEQEGIVSEMNSNGTREVLAQAPETS